MPVCVTSTCVISICATSSCVMSVCACVVSICMMSSCVMSTCVMSICVMSSCVMSSCVMSTCVMSICVMSSCVTSIFVMSTCVVSICVMSSCVMSICVSSTCVMSTCVMSICVMSSCVTSIFVMSICAMSSYVMSVCVCVMSICVVSVCVMSTCVMSICVISICVMSTCVMSICVMSGCVTSIFVMSICAMSSCVMSVCVCVMSICVVSVCVMSICVMPICVHSYPKHSKAPNPHASKTSRQNFRTSYWHSYPERNLHTARRQTRMPARHPHKIFAPPIGTATPNAIYTQQGTKPACQQDINANFSHLLLAQLPRTQFTHSKPPNPHARKTSTQNFRTSYWHSYPERNLHTARRQTRMPAGHQRKIFAAPTIGTATPNAIYTKHAAKPACQQEPRTQFTHSKPPNPHARKTSTQNFRISYCDSYPERNLHTSCRCSKSHACHAKAAAEQRRPRSAKAYIRPPAVQQGPRLPRESSGRAAETKERQSVHQTPCKSHTCHAKEAAEQRRSRSAKAYIRPPAVQQVPRLPRESSGRAAETKERQSVHQTPLQRSKSHACHTKAVAAQRRPRSAKAYIRPP